MTDMFCRDGVRMKVGVRRCSVGKNLGNQGSDVIIFLSNVISPYMRINQNCHMCASFGLGRGNASYEAHVVLITAAATLPSFCR